ncbi:MAG: NAD(P)/FAD-dependent oxidoreductase [Victivallales bacterium]|nr:NAD(P)/FAD-dependent oxidoreductase [Victivallales bacterium]
MEYDVIIIGAGISGIAAGIRLAHYGHKVRIFERHALPGGLNGWYRRNGREVEVGLHAITNFVPETARTAPFNKILRQLRVKRADLDLAPQGHSLIQFPGATLRLDNDFEHFREQIHVLFPQDAEHFDRLAERISSTAYSPDTVNGESTRSILEKELSTPLLREMLLCPVMFYGNPSPHDMDWHLFCTMFQSVLAEGFARPRTSMRAFLEVFLRRFEEEGGELTLGNGVRRICVEQGRATAVVDDRGEVHSAQKILSCAGAAETLALCDETRPIEVAEGAMGFVETIFPVSRPPREWGLDACIVFHSDQVCFPFEPPTHGLEPYSLLICAPGNYLGCENSDGAHTVRVSCITNSAWWNSLAEPAYREVKRACSAELASRMEALYPGFSALCGEAEMFTPRTIQRFTGHHNGAIYGSPQKFADGRVGIENLFVTGTDQGLLGVIGSLMSGTVIANAQLTNGN